jgi:hypothetical protein
MKGLNVIGVLTPAGPLYFADHYRTVIRPCFLLLCTFLYRHYRVNPLEVSATLMQEPHCEATFLH